jgi:20S proteasome alpha/beta subunit
VKRYAILFRPETPNRDRTYKPDLGERKPVTVCVATLFHWNYASAGEAARFGVGGIAASDRMITAGDVKYEPHQLKFAEMTPRTIVLVAGDYAVHSQAIQNTVKMVKTSRDQSPENIARLYGKSIQAIKQREAEDLYLAPLGMNSDTFVAQQKDMTDGFIERITSQLQSYEGEFVEALLIGSDTENAHLYSIDTRGIAHCMDDVGFAAIGIGAWHAKSRLMQMGYTNRSNLAPALAATFSAKRAADIAPGVGETTDVRIVLKDGHFPLWDHVSSKMHDLYKHVADGVSELVVEAVKELDEFITNPPAQEAAHDQPTGSATGNTQTDGGPSPAAPEDS